MVNTSHGVCSPQDMCEGIGVLLPVLDQTWWPLWLRAALYLLGLLWCLLGVTIIADVLMCSIEQITRHTRIVRVANSESESGYEDVKVRVWNDTVAYMTLGMTFGCCAPEILLAITEILANGFTYGELATNTVVGSAALNTLVICAVCIAGVDSPDTRKTKTMKVIIVTILFSILGYAWLFVILRVISPDVVEVWEATVIFTLFPVLILTAYGTSRNCCMCEPKTERVVEFGFGDIIRPMKWTNEAKMKHLIKELDRIHPNLSEDAVVRLAVAHSAEAQQHSRLWYRINGTRSISAGRNLLPTVSEDLEEVYGHLKRRVKPVGGAIDPAVKRQPVVIKGKDAEKAVIEFTAVQTAVLESDGHARIGIRRHGNTNSRVYFGLSTVDGTAVAGSDYTGIWKEFELAEGETEMYCDIKILDDHQWEPDEVFFITLSLNPYSNDYKTTTIGKIAVQEVTIIDDDNAGVIEFSRPSFLIKKSAGKVSIPVVRRDGAAGKVELTWSTEDMTARRGHDYEGGMATLIFGHGEIKKTIEIDINDDKEKEGGKKFKVELGGIQGDGASLGKRHRCIVNIVNDDDFPGLVNRLVDLTNSNMDLIYVPPASWTEQFRNAMNVNGGDLGRATRMDYVLHFFSFAWKIFFAMVPPTYILRGWISFFIALIMVGFFTTIIHDLARIFGCLVGLRDSVIAIAFIALGFRLPDIVASKQCASQEKYADKSIGNIAGATAAGLFLGVGLPWMIVAIYRQTKGELFIIPEDALGINIAMYVIGLIFCLILLCIRRCCGAELGGAKGPKYLSAIVLVLLWLGFVIASCLYAYGYFKINSPIVI